MEIFCDLSPRIVPGFSNYYVDGYGNVYRSDMSLIPPFNSNGYKQVCLKDDNNKRRVLGVHQVVAMAFLEYFNGCVVHHMNEDKAMNVLYNLKVETKEEHARHHANPSYMIEYIRIHGVPYKCTHPSEESRRKMSESAKKRGFNGNQFRRK